MSNYLAIATVTAALTKLLQEGVRDDVPGAVVTTLRPDSQAPQAASINLYLYQATPNPAWRNADLRTNRPKGNLTKHGQAGLDLYYLLTFYGEEQKLEPQRLMGSAIKVLVDKPILTSEIILDTLQRPSIPSLAASNLADQVDLVTFIPTSMTTEELSRIWSIFFQVPYCLSFAFQGTAVLIEGDKPGKAALPVRRRQISIGSARPVIEKVKPQETLDEAITCSSSLVILGRQFQGRGQQERQRQVQDEATQVPRQVAYVQTEITQIRVGRAKVTPQEVTDNEVKIQLSLLNAEEARLLRAGVQGLQVVRWSVEQTTSDGQPTSESRYSVESNVMPLVLCPTIVEAEIERGDIQEQAEGKYQATITVPVDVVVSPEQRAFLLLNGFTDNNAQTYIFAAARRTVDANSLVFLIRDVIAGSYLVRVQIDGAESPLTLNANEQYSGPSLVIP